ncbi:hypothetical protein HRbin23_00864 [bacterium HR23]|nr:hypothetical protein HRbin23_00864 [bacterium HR23]
MKPETRDRLKRFIADFVRRKLKPLQNISVTELRRAYPFHDLFFRDDALLAFKLQRSIVTSLGLGFYAQVAKIIGSERFAVSRIGQDINCDLPGNTCNTIERIVTELRLGQRKPSHQEELKEILSSTDGEMRSVPIRADLYLDGGPTGPLFLELKSPKPNLDVCPESKRKMLYFIAFARRQNLGEAQAFLALYYNPYFPKTYSWRFTTQVLDMNSEVLIGENFWDTVGGASTYEELLDVLAEVKQELRPQ